MPLTRRSFSFRISSMRYRTVSARGDVVLVSARLLRIVLASAFARIAARCGLECNWATGITPDKTMWRLRWPISSEPALQFVWVHIVVFLEQ